MVANGVGTTGAGELEGTTALEVLDGGGGGGGAEVELGVIPITRKQVSPSIDKKKKKKIRFQHTGRGASNCSVNGRATASGLRSRASQRETLLLQMERLMGMTASSMTLSNNASR